MVARIMVTIGLLIFIGSCVSEPQRKPWTMKNISDSVERENNATGYFGEK